LGALFLGSEVNKIRRTVDGNLRLQLVQSVTEIQEEVDHHEINVPEIAAA
jgi:hypothetical protein